MYSGDSDSVKATDESQAIFLTLVSIVILSSVCVWNVNDIILNIAMLGYFFKR